MSRYETVLYEVNERVATITLNRPKVLNALDTTLRREVIEAVTAAAADAEVRVVVLTGSGRAFCSGADLAEKQPDNVLPQLPLEDEIKPALMAIAQAPKPFIAAINGVAGGGGVGYALACDLVLMADNASLLLPFVSIGLIPDAGTTWHLLNQLGAKRAFELISSGEKLSAACCVELGLANRVVPADALLDEAQRWAVELANKAPMSLRYAKQALAAVAPMSLAEAISYEALLQNRLGRSEDSAEGIRAFLEKRKPTFVGR